MGRNPDELLTRERKTDLLLQETATLTKKLKPNSGKEKSNSNCCDKHECPVEIHVREILRDF